MAQANQSTSDFKGDHLSIKMFAAIDGATIPIGDGASHPLSGHFSTLAEAQAVYPFLTSTFRGLAWGDCELAAIALQAGINNAGCSELYVPAGVYRLNVYIDIANRVLGGFKLRGSLWISRNSSLSTVFVGNSGGVLFDISGSEFVSLEDFSIVTGGATPSTIGVLYARTTDNTGYFQSQFNQTRNLAIGMHHDPTANGGVGTFAIYNFASELAKHYNLYVTADNPYFGSFVNPAPYYARRGDGTSTVFLAQSPNPSVHVAGAIGSPAFGSIGNTSFDGQCSFNTMMQPALSLNGVSSFYLTNGYFRNDTGVFGRHSTTIAASISAGARTVTPASMSPGGSAIAAGSVLTVGNADGSNTEVVFVSAVTGTTFTATFASAKTGPGIVAQIGDPNLAAINIQASAGSDIRISGLAEEFDKVMIARGIAFNLDLNVSRGHANASIPSIDFDNAGGAAVPGISGGKVTVTQGDFSTATTLLGGDPAVLFCDAYMGPLQGISLASGSFGYLDIISAEWAPAINLGTIPYCVHALGRIKPVARMVSPPGQYGEMTQHTGISISNDLMVIGATNSTPIVITVEGDHNLANAQAILTFGILGNTAADGSLYAKTASYGSSQFAVYSDAALTLPVAGSGTYTTGGTVRAAARDSFLRFADAGTAYWQMKHAADHSLQVYDIAQNKTILNAKLPNMILGAAGYRVYSAEDLQSLRDFYVSRNTALGGTVTISPLAGAGSKILGIDNFGVVNASSAVATSQGGTGAGYASFALLAAAILGSLTAAQIATALGYSPASATDLSSLKSAYNAHHHTGVTVGAGTSGTTDTPA